MSTSAQPQTQEPEPSQALVPPTEKPLVETASVAVAAQARASVEARYLVALRNPRSMDTVRVRILAACKRPKFAEAARYTKPVGGKSIVGPSIRFAEEAVRALGNVYVESMVLFDDDKRRMVRVTGTDLEANLSYHQDLLIEKMVERSSVRDGQVVVSSRLNTKGKKVYLIEATDDDLLVKQAAMTSKAVRTIVLRLLPGDILDEAMEQVEATVRAEDANDPASARKRLCDAFYDLGVEPKDLEDYLGHDLPQTTPAELTLLRTIYTALKDGEATWADVLDTKGKTPQFKRADRGTGALKETLGGSKAAPAPERAPSAAASAAETERGPEPPREVATEDDDPEPY